MIATWSGFVNQSRVKSKLSTRVPPANDSDFSPQAVAPPINAAATAKEASVFARVSLTAASLGISGRLRRQPKVARVSLTAASLGISGRLRRQPKVARVSLTAASLHILDV